MTLTLRPVPARPRRRAQSRVATVAMLFPLALVPSIATAERIAPLAPPPSFDTLTVPLPPQRPEPPAVRVVPNPAPIIIVPPGSTVVPPPPVRLERTQAQVPAATESDPISDGLDALLGNVLREMQPTFDDMARGLDGAQAKVGPALSELGDLVDDIGNYQAPERLPNGDILIRRRADAPPAPDIGPAMRNLTAPGGDGATATAPPATGATPTPPAPVPPATTPPDGDQPALANPIPDVPTDPSQPSIDL